MTIITERPTLISSTEARGIMASLPTSVTVVAGEPELSDEKAAMIVGSFVVISLDPCLVGFFVGRESTSWPKLNTAAVLGISTLASSQKDFCRKLGKKEADRFADCYWTRGVYGAPLVTDSVLSMECQVDAITQVGDHDFVLARVLGFSSGAANPLIFQNHGFSELLSLG